MKKFILIAMAVVGTLSVSAQQKVYLSTYTGTNISKFSGQECTITAPRYMCKGWNTVALPFSMSESEVNAAFGDDCRLERLTSAKSYNGAVVLNFQDCKSGGIQANTPYILYYTGESGTKNIKVTAVVEQGIAVRRVNVEGSDEEVAMWGAQMQESSKGRYGILARDNAEASFVNVDNINSGFGATRCFITLSSGNNTNLVTTHNAETTGISSSLKGNVGMNSDTPVYNLSGQQMKTVQKGVNIINGRKVIVK